MSRQALLEKLLADVPYQQLKAPVAPIRLVPGTPSYQISLLGAAPTIRAVIGVSLDTANRKVETRLLVARKGPSGETMEPKVCDVLVEDPLRNRVLLMPGDFLLLEVGAPGEGTPSQPFHVAGRTTYFEYDRAALDALAVALGEIDHQIR